MIFASGLLTGILIGIIGVGLFLPSPDEYRQRLAGQIRSRALHPTGRPSTDLESNGDLPSVRVLNVTSIRGDDDLGIVEGDLFE